MRNNKNTQDMISIKPIDLRSDTVTKPTAAMREAMKNAVVGDDVYGDDPSVNELERYAAEVLGKEAALFVPSGTFGNQLALLTHCGRGDEVILDEKCHIVEHEAGASAVIAGVQLRTVPSVAGIMDTYGIEERIRKTNDIHYPKTGLICVENAHSCGRVADLSYMECVFNLARIYNIPIHLDGARLFNAAAYLGVPVREIACFADSVMLCLSKGLCAPIGSILAGNMDFINAARKRRKLMGGGMRQAGVLAAPGLIALRDMSGRLFHDNKTARFIASELAEIEGVNICIEDVHINMVFFDILATGADMRKFEAGLQERGIIINGAENGVFRLVTHYWITEEDATFVAAAIREILGILKAGQAL